MKRCLTFAAAMALAACGGSRDGTNDSHSAAYQTGRAAHEVARGAGKAAKVLGRELEHGAVKAHEGWQDQARRDREHDRQKDSNR